MSLVGKIKHVRWIFAIPFQICLCFFLLFYTTTNNEIGFYWYVLDQFYREEKKNIRNKVKCASLCPVQVWKTYIEFMEQNIH